MKIGIMIKDFEALANWELRIIKGILDDPSLELILLIKDGRKKNIKTSNRFIRKLNKFLKSKNFFGYLLFEIQSRAENLIFRKQYNSVNRLAIIKELKKIEKIDLFPERKGFLDVFNKDDVNKIKKYNLDIILRYEFNIIRGEILNASKYGIWSFHHADNSINRGGPAGFWEIVLKQPVIGVTLQKLTSELDGGLVIDKGFFNIHWSYILAKRLIFESSVSILFKNIRKLQNGEFSPRKSIVYYNPLYKIPKFNVMIKYMFNFYKNLISKKIIEKINSRIFGTRYYCWTLFIGKGNFLNSTLYKLKPIYYLKTNFGRIRLFLSIKKTIMCFLRNMITKQTKGKYPAVRFIKIN